MAFWTLQSKAVLEKSKKDGIFYPDFSFSSQLHIADYQRVLNAFNKINKTNYRGLIFCLAPEQSESLGGEYKTVGMVEALFRGNRNIRGSLATEPYSLFDENHVLLKIDGGDFETTNTIPIDYWNHIIVMDGGSPEFFYLQKDRSVFCDMNYEAFENLIFKSIETGKYAPPIMPTSTSRPYNTMTELHIPFIRFSSILEIHEASEL